MKRFRIIHKDHLETYEYFLDKDEKTGRFVLSFLYYDRGGSYLHIKDISFNLENFFGDTKEEVLLEANNWIKKNLWENFIIEEVI